MMRARLAVLGPVWTGSLLLVAGLAGCASSGHDGVTGPMVIIRPPSAVADLMVAEVAARRGDMDLAVRRYLGVARASRDPEVAERAARLAAYAQRDEEALRASELWIEVAPQNTEARQLAATLAIRLDRPEQAAPHLKAWFAGAEGDDEQRYLMVATLLAREENAGAALKALRLLVQGQDANAAAQYAVGQLAHQADDLVLARAAAERVVALRPDWATGWNLMARVRVAQGEEAQVASELAAVVDRTPDHYELRAVYAHVLVDAGRYAEAHQQYQTLLKQRPDDGDVILALALMAMDAHRLDEARNRLLRLVELNLHTDEAAYYLGRLAEQQRRYDEADRWYSRVQHGQHRTNARIQRAILHARGGNIDESLALLRQLRERHPAMELRMVLAEIDILREADRFQEAYDLVTNHLASYPDHRDLLYARAIVAERMGRIDIAEQDLRQVLANDPDSASALNALGYTLADLTDRHAEAKGYIERALAIRPDDAAILDSMGWVLFKLNRPDEALTYLKRALELSGDAEIAAHLGEVQWKLGRQKEARRVWKEALDRDPEHRVLLDVLRRFPPP